MALSHRFYCSTFLIAFNIGIKHNFLCINIGKVHLNLQRDLVNVTALKKNMLDRFYCKNSIVGYKNVFTFSSHQLEFSTFDLYMTFLLIVPDKQNSGMKIFD